MNMLDSIQNVSSKSLNQDWLKSSQTNLDKDTQHIHHKFSSKQ